MNKDLQDILKALRKRGGESSGGINFDLSEEGALRLRGSDGYTPQKGIDYWTPEEVNETVTAIFKAAKPTKGVDYYTDTEKRQFVSEILKMATPVKGVHYRDGIDGKDGRDGKDADEIDARKVAIDAINFLESFEGDARLSAKALKDLDEAVTDILKKGADFELSEKQITTIKDLLPKYPPMNAGGSGATFLKSLRDVDLSGLTKNADGKYALGGGTGSSTFLALTDTPAAYTGQAGKLAAVNTGETGIEFIAPPSGSGDVVGPASSVADRIAVFNGLTGKVIKDGGSTIANVLNTDNHTDGTNNKVFTAADDAKLTGIEALADVTDAGNVGSSIHGATAKTTPVDADTMPLIDSAAANVLKKVTWANIKATIKAYTDTLYAAALGADDNYVTDAEKTKLGHISITQAVDLDALETASHAAVTVADSAEIDFTLTGQQITASLKSGSIDETKLDASVNASLDLADTAVQPAGLSSYFQTANIDDTPVNGETAAPISSNWAYDHENSTTAHGATGAVVGTTNTQTLTNKRVTPRVSSETSSATPTINVDNVDAHSITALATAITSMTTNLSGTPTNFQKLIIRIKDNGTARAITWGASFEAKGVALPTTTVISKVLTVGFIYDTVTSKWGCVASVSEA